MKLLVAALLLIAPAFAQSDYWDRKEARRIRSEPARMRGANAGRRLVPGRRGGAGDRREPFRESMRIPNELRRSFRGRFARLHPGPRRSQRTLRAGSIRASRATDMKPFAITGPAPAVGSSER